MFTKYFGKSRLLKIDNLYIGYVATLYKNGKNYVCDSKNTKLIAFLKEDHLYHYGCNYRSEILLFLSLYRIK